MTIPTCKWIKNFSTCQNNFPTCKNILPTCQNNFPTCLNILPTCPNNVLTCLPKLFSHLLAKIIFPPAKIIFPHTKIIFPPAKIIFPPAKIIFPPAKIIFAPAWLVFEPKMSLTRGPKWPHRCLCQKHFRCLDMCFLPAGWTPSFSSATGYQHTLEESLLHRPQQIFLSLLYAKYCCNMPQISI